MKKVFLPLILLIMLFTFSSCSNKDSNKESPKNSPPPKEAPAPKTDISPTSSPDGSAIPTVKPLPKETPTIADKILKAGDLFPLTNDTHWKYRGYGNEFAFFDAYVEYVRGNTIQVREENGGDSVIKVYKSSGGMVKKVYERSGVFYRYDFTKYHGNEEILIKEPIAVGTSWTLSNGSIRKITGINVNVSTPSGQYKAVEVTTTRSGSVHKDYYARGTGLVKRVYISSSGDTVSSELEKIQRNVPFTHTVRFYFPEFDNERLVYMDRNISISTNQDMKWQFQRELKIIPNDPALRKVLTPNVQILSWKIDFAKGIVTVNFSSELVTEMNAGSTLESLIINSIVNTFGNYCKMNKVIIQVEGAPYSGGHIAIGPGEYFTVNTGNAVKYQ